MSMKRLNTSGALVAVVGVAVGLAFASSIKPEGKSAWSENAGWSNWRDAGETGLGVSVELNTLSGWIWFENIGWCSLASGDPPALGWPNITGADYGVNVELDYRLDGFAWSENVGWLRFDSQLPAPFAPRIDLLVGRLRGFVWGENIGWLNLDGMVHFVALEDSADNDLDGDIDLLDFATFQRCFGWESTGGASCTADTDFDDDDDTDIDDWSMFHAQISGPN
ncbi:MAG: hypothetical protein KDA54_21320 [Phycisphaerales bacterium]|nr:hypothetical protein [Phycisphaerales bacterium]